MSAKRKIEKAAKSVEAADVAIAKQFTPVRNHPVVKAIGKASEVGDQPPLYAISAGVFTAGVMTGDRRAAKAGLRMLAAHFLTIRFKDAIKHVIDRSRPDLIAKEGKYEMRPGHRTAKDYTSFPSGHTASSVAVALAYGREYPKQRGAAVGLASAIAVAQVVRSKHFVSDLIAGAAVGIAAEHLAERWLRKMAQP